MEAEALAVAIGPFVVVEQAPEEIALNRVAFGGGAVHVSQVVAKEHHAVGIFDAAVGSKDIVGGSAVFRDVEGLGLPDFRYVANGPVNSFRADLKPGGSHVRVGGLHGQNLVSGGGSIGAGKAGVVDIVADEVERAADGLHVTGLDLGGVRSFALEIAIGVLAFHHRGEKRRVFFARGLLGGFDVLAAFDDRHEYAGIFGEADLRSRFGIGANGLHA